MDVTVAMLLAAAVYMVVAGAVWWWLARRGVPDDVAFLRGLLWPYYLLTGRPRD